MHRQTGAASKPMVMVGCMEVMRKRTDCATNASVGWSVKMACRPALSYGRWPSGVGDEGIKVGDEKGGRGVME
jgi:hypothetical protein